MAITNELTPDLYNMAFGQNLFAFTGLVTEDKYVIKVKDGITVLADLRQAANPAGDAIFDIQNILQSYVSPSHYWIEQLGIYDQDPGIATANVPFTNSALENYGYNIEYGSETDGVYTAIQTLTGFNALGGTKAYYSNYWKYTEYQPRVATDTDQCGSTIVTRQARVLTDWQNEKRVDTLQGGYPAAFMAGTQFVLQYDRTTEQHLTASFFNKLERVSTPSTPDAKSIEGFFITSFNGATQLSQTFIPNLVINGCGPNVNRNDANIVTDTNLVCTMGVGPKNLELMRYYGSDPGSAQIYALDSNATHYYITAHSATPIACPNTEVVGVSDDPLFTPIRVDIVTNTCLDYEPLEFSWQNSFGFRDYFVLDKKQQQSVSVGRNNYLNSPVNFDGDATDAGAVYGNRGYTTYSQKIEERYLATTGFMSDATALYLRNLYQSPDVRVRLTDKYAKPFDGVFFPVNMLTNRWNEKNFQKDKLFQYEATFKLANNIKSMRG